MTETLVLTRRDVQAPARLGRVHRGGRGRLPPPCRGTQPGARRARRARAARRIPHQGGGPRAGPALLRGQDQRELLRQPAPAWPARHPGRHRPVRRRRRAAAGRDGLDRGHDPPHGGGDRGRGAVPGAPGGARGDRSAAAGARAERSCVRSRACCRSSAPGASTRTRRRPTSYADEMSARAGHRSRARGHDPAAGLADERRVRDLHAVAEAVPAARGTCGPARSWPRSARTAPTSRSWTRG